MSWVAEDSYISFRYARNFIEGHGLVFNPGERVEGYTNFLWTLLLALGLGIGAQPETISLALGLICTGGAFLALWRLHQRLFPQSLLSGTLLALCFNYTWACFSTSGMETSLLGLLLACIFLATALPDQPEKRLAPAVTGFLLALAVATRPDAILIFPAVACAYLLQRRGVRHWIILISGFCALYAPYFLWRWSYYGDLLPNTFYAKSGGISYYSQGWAYLVQFLSRYTLWIFLPLPIVAALRTRERAALPAAMAVFILIYSFYVVRVGGDFMEGRFFVPVIPFLYLLLEWAIRRLLPRTTWVAAGIALLVLGSAADHGRLPERTIVNGITDERTWQPVVQAWLHEGEIMRRHLPHDTVIATDAVGAFGWQSRLPVIDTLGLTDRTVAHLPVTQRSRPGHEKSAPLDYLRARKTAVVRDGVGLYHSAFNQSDFQFAGNRYYLLSSNPEVISGFREAQDELTSSDSKAK